MTGVQTCALPISETSYLKDGKPFFIPAFSNDVEYETELVFKICRLGKNISKRFAHRYYDSVTVGVDFTARDLQKKLRESGEPWDLSKGFDNSAAAGEFIPFDRENPVLNFHLEINGKTVQSGINTDMIYSIDEIIEYVSRFYTLKIGDLIFTGTPAGVGPVKINDHVEGYIGDKKLLSFNIK